MLNVDAVTECYVVIPPFLWVSFKLSNEAFFLCCSSSISPDNKHRMPYHHGRVFLNMPCWIVILNQTVSHLSSRSSRIIQRKMQLVWCIQINIVHKWVFGIQREHQTINFDHMSIRKPQNSIVDMYWVVHT